MCQKMFCEPVNVNAIDTCKWKCVSGRHSDGPSLGDVSSAPNDTENTTQINNGDC